MIYLDSIQTYDSLGVYLEVDSIEKKEGTIVISGTVGDGYYEGEVHVICGERQEVTFLDAWLGGEGLDDFLNRYGDEDISRAILAASPTMLDFARMRRSACCSMLRDEDTPLFNAA